MEDVMRGSGSVFVFMLALLVGTACGGDVDKDNSDNPNSGANNSANTGGDCSLELPLDGAVSQTLSWGAAEGCGGATSGGLVTMTFGAFGADSVQMGFTDTMFGAPGTHETYVRFRNADDAEWTAQACSVELTTNEVVDTDPEFGDTYLFAGTGNCTAAATATAGGADGEITIGDFEFSNDSIPGPN